MKWTCDEITMLSPPELGKTGRMIIAEPAVVFDVMDDRAGVSMAPARRPFTLTASPPR